MNNFNANNFDDALDIDDDMTATQASNSPRIAHDESIQQQVFIAQMYQAPEVQVDDIISQNMDEVIQRYDLVEEQNFFEAFRTPQAFSDAFRLHWWIPEIPSNDFMIAIATSRCRLLPRARMTYVLLKEVCESILKIRHHQNIINVIAGSQALQDYVTADVHSRSMQEFVLQVACNFSNGAVYSVFSYWEQCISDSLESLQQTAQIRSANAALSENLINEIGPQGMENLRMVATAKNLLNKKKKTLTVVQKAIAQANKEDEMLRLLTQPQQNDAQTLAKILQVIPRRSATQTIRSCKDVKIETGEDEIETITIVIDTIIRKTLYPMKISQKQYFRRVQYALIKPLFQLQVFERLVCQTTVQFRVARPDLNFEGSCFNEADQRHDFLAGEEVCTRIEDPAPGVAEFFVQVEEQKQPLFQFVRHQQNAAAANVLIKAPIPAQNANLGRQPRGPPPRQPRGPPPRLNVQEEAKEISSFDPLYGNRNDEQQMSPPKTFPTLKVDSSEKMRFLLTSGAAGLNLISFGVTDINSFFGTLRYCRRCSAVLKAENLVIYDCRCYGCNNCHLHARCPMHNAPIIHGGQPQITCQFTGTSYVVIKTPHK